MNDNPTPDEQLQKEADAVVVPTQAQLEKELEQPPKESTKPLLFGLIALLIGSVTGFVLWLRGVFSDKET